MSRTLTRRGFLLTLSAAGAAAGLGLGIQPAHAGDGASSAFTPNVFVSITPEGTVFILSLIHI